MRKLLLALLIASAVLAGAPVPIPNPPAHVHLFDRDFTDAGEGEIH
ncbi:hypothetical protein [Dactylosporangium sp. NPDC051541]